MILQNKECVNYILFVEIHLLYKPYKYKTMLLTLRFRCSDAVYIKK